MDLADEVTQSIKEDYRTNQYKDNNNDGGGGGSFDSSKSEAKVPFGAFDGSPGEKIIVEEALQVYNGKDSTIINQSK